MLNILASILYLCPLLWAILSCWHFAAILKYRKDQTGEKTACRAAMLLTVTDSHLTNSETMYYQTVTATYDHQNTPVTVTV
jgi:hypothetical protein